MYLLILLLPLSSAIIAGFFGKFLGNDLIKKLTIGNMVLTTLLSFIAFYKIALKGNAAYLTLFTWINLELFFVQWGLLFDTVTVVMLLVVTIVSTLVHIYSTDYMSADPHLGRFMSYLSLFTFFMLVLVTSNNFLQMFLGWEGVGICSYLLISFWYTRIQANKAAIKALLVNRVGDFALGVGLVLIFLFYRTLDFSTVFAITPFFEGKTFIFLNQDFQLLNVICFFLFIGAVGKSAQIGLHTWLPDAMEGPTPVSALIHAATMVTAGVFLIIRCSPMFEYVPDILLLITFVGAATSFFSATTGMLQNDIKRVIAYSTCSQLGYMIFVCGLSNYSLGLFHLANHAFFKALLFLSAGAVIHSLSDEQDMRKMGGLLKILPLIYTTMLIGSLALMGFPFLTGFYSKDIIIEIAFGKYTIMGTFAYWFAVMSAFFTSYYSLRLLYLTFLSNTNSYKSYFKHFHAPSDILIFPLVILAIGSIFVGYVGKDMFIGMGTDFFNNAIFVLPKNNVIVNSEFMPYYIKLIPFFCSMGAVVLLLVGSYFFNSSLIQLKLTGIGNKLYWFLNKKWFFDIAYKKFIIYNILLFGYHVTFKMIDRGFLRCIGPVGISNQIYQTSQKLSNMQSGFLTDYIFAIVFGGALLCFILFFNLDISGLI